MPLVDFGLFFNIVTFLNIFVVLQFLSVSSFSVLGMFLYFHFAIGEHEHNWKGVDAFYFEAFGFKNEIDSFSTC